MKNCLGSITQTCYQHFCQIYLRMSLRYITIMVIMGHLVYFIMQLSWSIDWKTIFLQTRWFHVFTIKFCSLVNLKVIDASPVELFGL